MPTLLVTNKMSPELARRVQASVSGRKRPGGHKSRSPSAVALIRLVTLALVGGAIVGWISLRQRAQDELARLREDVLATVSKASHKLSVEDRRALPRIERALSRAAGVYEGDWVEPALASGTALAALLEKPLVYVRGAVDGFGTPEAIAESARASQKDAFLLCLLDPPPARTEKALLERVSIAYSSRHRVDERTPSGYALYEVEAGAPFFAPEFGERVSVLKDRRRLEELQRSVARAPLARASEAAKARTLVYVLDEPGDRSKPMELDGERARHVRVGVVDLASDKVLLRLRKYVDPAWISLTRRSQYASGLGACALSVDVRAHVSPSVPSAPASVASAGPPGSSR